MKKNIYKLVSIPKQRLLALALTVFLGTAYSQATYTYNFTGTVQTLSLPAGNYSVECWGAIGGWHANDVSMLRGKGGYSSGTFTLPSTTNLYISVGGAGGAQINGTVPGGWNGGGNAKYYTYSYNGGGGASHVATGLIGGGLLSGYSSNQSSVVVVAGGGGGGCTSITPGNGGGATGGNSTRSGCTGGTQTTPGSSSISGGNATFGQGWDGTPTGGSYGAGGGGWYGGGCESAGSGYIGGLTSGQTVMFGQTGYVTNPDVSGNGFVIIRELCSISLYAANNTNSLNPMICAGQSVTLMTNAISNYLWSTGATTSSLVVSPVTTSVYALTATSPSNCISTKNITVTVSSAPPVLSIANPSSNICLGKTVSLTASGAVTYTWANPGIVNGQTFTPNATAVYTVTGQNGCGLGTSTTTITVAPLAISTLASPTLVCQGSPSTLTAVSAGTSYTWMPGSIPGASVTVVPTSNSIYTVSVSDGTCAGTQTVAINTKITPTVNVSSTSSAICEGEQLVITANGANTYTWMPGNQTGNTVTVSPQTSTVYVVTGENAVGCFASNQQVVLVNPSPTLNVTASKLLVCAGQTVFLNTTGGSTYTWTGGPSTASNVVTPNANTVYTVTGNHTLNICTDVTTIAIGALTSTLTLPTNTQVCEGGSVTVYANGATKYTWNSVSSGSVGVYNVFPQTTNTVTLVATTQSLTTTCPTTHTFEILVNPLPSLTVTAKRAVVCRNETNTLTVSGAQTYTWTSTVGGTSMVITPSANTTYTVAGTDAKGCANIFNYAAKVNACTGIESSTIGAEQLQVFPNPNQGMFTIRSESPMDLVLVNELGQELSKFKLQESNKFTYEFKDLKPGMYFIHSENRSGAFVQKIVVN